MILSKDCYKINIEFPFGELNNMITWCKNNCKGRWGVGESDNGYTFHFQDERDYFMFKIWK